jgi:hypothetical protein
MIGGPQSFDIFLLGVKDASPPGRRKFFNAMARLTGREEEEFHESLSRSSRALFTTLSHDQAQMALNVLDEAGVLIEIRPNSSEPQGGEQQMVATHACPTCGFINPAEGEECQRCGLVFAKWERESVQRMQREQRLEEALSRALQVREEWTTRAKAYLENHPLPETASEPFAGALLSEEIPFLGLVSDEGDLLMTSRRLLYERDGGIGSIPYELIADVDVGGGLVQRKNRTRLDLTFPAALMQPGGESDNTVAFWLDKESTFYKDVVMDWAFARSFTCGSCGAHDLDFRNEGAQVRFRCMHCATDHEVDLVEAIAIPVIHEE